MRLFVPGRVCLFGEHSDWAGGHRRSNSVIEKGYTIVCGTDQGISALVEPHPTHLELSAVMDHSSAGPVIIPMQPDVLLAMARSGGFWSYIAGVAYQAQQRFSVKGLVIHNDHTDLPVQKGLSSSAAICVLAARAFNQVYGLGLSVREEMELAYQGEITTPSRCGRMDQCCAFGRPPVLMKFDGDHLETAPLAVGGELRLVIVDLLAHKDTRKILADLNAAYPYATNQQQQDLQNLLGPLNRDTVMLAVEALRAGDARTLGRLMTSAQENFDRYAAPLCPQELHAPVLHRLLNYSPLQDLAWGGKGMGSQGDGSAQLLARDATTQQAIIDLVQGELRMHAIALTIAPTITEQSEFQAVL